VIDAPLNDATAETVSVSEVVDVEVSVYVYVAIPSALVTFADETVVTLRPARDHETAAPTTGRQTGQQL